ncbi:MAG: chloride channel protein [Flavobacteriales bacterium]|nr:chloride channel protein [Flavobacteriales bacterium]
MYLFAKIRIYIKKRFDSISNNKLKSNLLQALPFWIGSLVTGIVAVIYAKLFLLAEEATIYFFDLNKYILFILTPLCFFASWWIVNKYAPHAKGSGIPQISAGIELANPRKYHLVSHFASMKVIAVKVLSSLIMVLGGGLIGREGPTIQISASIFKKINDLLPKWYPKISKKNMLITGVASGLAAAFNTPLGGIVFTIEELTKIHFNYFKSALISGVIISGLTALNILGPYLYVGYPKVDNTSYWVVIPVVITALITGYFSGYMGKLILKIIRKKNTLNRRKTILFCIVGGLLIATVGFFVGNYTFGSGKDIIQETLFTNEKYVDWYIPFVRFFGSVISFVNGAAGGIFAPSLSIGASIGSVISGILELPASDSNLVILCGMVGFLTGITRSPFTSSILVLEMTTAENSIFYLMISALIANLIASVADKYSLYEHLKEDYLEDVYTKHASSLKE